MISFKFFFGDFGLNFCNILLLNNKLEFAISTELTSSSIYCFDRPQIMRVEIIRLSTRKYIKSKSYDERYSNVIRLSCPLLNKINILNIEK